MKVLLINAINPYAEIEYRYPPLGMGYLAKFSPGPFWTGHLSIPGCEPRC